VTWPKPAPLPDVERLVSNWLRGDVDVFALVGDRVYTAMPQQAEFPLILIQRVGGTPPFSIPLTHDLAQLQLDAYADGKALAHEVLGMALATLSVLEDQVQPEGVVSAVRFGAIRWMPDEAFKKAKPRYIVDVTLNARSLRGDEALAEAVAFA
jgi:hypothetical protein